MNNFGYALATDIADAVRQITADPEASLLPAAPTSSISSRNT